MLGTINCKCNCSWNLSPGLAWWQIHKFYLCCCDVSALCGHCNHM